jgi:threonine dehydrogenase-like Zn-dependent dehydrogenase
MVTLSRTIFGFFSLWVLVSEATGKEASADDVAVTGCTLGLLVLAVATAAACLTTALVGRLAATTRFFAANGAADGVADEADFLAGVLAAVDGAAEGVVISVVAMRSFPLQKVK